MPTYYTGVGSRATPTEILDFMRNFAAIAASRGWTLRSGGAVGADSAFQKGANESCEIYVANHSTTAAEAIAARYHPAWDRCSPYVKTLHGRNAFQVLGMDLATPSYCVLCWTPDGCIHHNERTIRTGGTGTAISIASMSNIPVWNLQRLDHQQTVIAWMTEIPENH